MSTTSMGTIFKKVVKREYERADHRKSLAHWYERLRAEDNATPMVHPMTVEEWEDKKRALEGESDAP